MEARRAALQRRLSAFAPSGGDAGAEAALRNILGDNLRYAADLDYVEREADRLISARPSVPAPHHTLWIWGALGALLACVIVGRLVIYRRQNQGLTGDERMRVALRDLQRYASAGGAP